MTSTSAPEGARSRALVVPGDLTGPSGGNHYDERVVAEFGDMGLDVAVETVPGAWPRPTDDDRRVLREVLGRHTEVVVDGLVGSAAPDEIAWARSRGVRVAVLVHLPLPAEGGLSAADAERLGAMEAAALRAAGTVVATSEWARDDLMARYGLTSVQAVPPGSDAAPLATGSTPAHLLFLGTISPRKNPLLLLEALGAVLDRRWTASLVGPSGPDEDYTQAVQARAESLAGRVRVLGPRQGEELEALWRTVDLLVLPSTAETYGLVVTEALAHGIPALVSSGTGAMEALHGSGERDGLAAPGARVDPADPQAWAAALAGWLDDEQLRYDWRAAARDHRDRLRGWATTAADLRTALRW